MSTITQRAPKQTRREEEIAYEIVTLRDKNVCQRCRRHCGPPTRDHRKNRSQGGRTVPSNLQILGGSGTTGCHGWATAHPAEAIAEGWAVPGWADPLVWPARRYISSGHGTLTPIWVIYDDRGGWKRISDEDAARRMAGED